MKDLYNVITECGIECNWADFQTLDEASQLKVTDDALTGMLKFVTDHYNSLDMRELEKSAGDIAKFKYLGMLKSNTETLLNIYEASPDTGAKNYVKVCYAIQHVLGFLGSDRRLISDQYKAGNGIIQLMYTSLVAGCIYSLGILVANTIRFVTTEQDTDCQVLYDEIPGTIKNIHIKNILAADADLDDFHKLVVTYNQTSNSRAMQENVSLAAVKAGLAKVYASAPGPISGTIAVGKELAVKGAALAAAHPVVSGIVVAGTIIYMLPKLIVLVREIIYSIYYLRVKVSDMLGVQADLINTNIESLEAGRGSKKVIVRQRKIAEKLTKWQDAIAVKIDNNAVAVNSQKRVENQKLKLDKNSPLMQDPGALASGDLML